MANTRPGRRRGSPRRSWRARRIVCPAASVASVASAASTSWPLSKSARLVGAVGSRRGRRRPSQSQPSARLGLPWASSEHATLVVASAAMKTVDETVVVDRARSPFARAHLIPTRVISSTTSRLPSRSAPVSLSPCTVIECGSPGSADTSARARTRRRRARRGAGRACRVRASTPFAPRRGGSSAARGARAPRIARGKEGVSHVLQLGQCARAGACGACRSGRPSTRAARESSRSVTMGGRRSGRAVVRSTC